MHFDLFYELSLPEFSDRDETAVFDDTLGELALADELGFHCAWLVEHHFMPHYSHSSSPELFLAAASQRTRRLRLGHAIIPLPYNHPVRTAERLATLDVLSHGRLEFGFGRGFTPEEYAAFGVQMKDSRSVTQECLEIILEGLRDGRVDYRGEHFALSDLNILPATVQRPHPPVWGAAVSPESFELAAKLGVGALVGPFKPWFMVKEDIKRYRRIWTQTHGETPTPEQNNKVGMTLGVFCHENHKEARRQAKQAIEWFYTKLLGQTRVIIEKLYDSYEYYRRMGPLHSLFSKTINLKMLETAGMVVVGDPDHCIKKFRKLEAAGVDHVLCAMGAGAMPSEQVRASMQLLASEVMPAFSAR